nr:hypothetical protein [Tanacetum cinerariifolium]
PEISTGLPSMTIITESAPAVFTTSLESQTLPLDTGVTGIQTSFPTCDNNVFEPYIASEASFSNTLNVEIKLDEYGEVLKNKARLVKKGNDVCMPVTPVSRGSVCDSKEVVKTAGALSVIIVIEGDPVEISGAWAALTRTEGF